MKATIIALALVALTVIAAFIAARLREAARQIDAALADPPPIPDFTEHADQACTLADPQDDFADWEKELTR